MASSADAYNETEGFDDYNPHPYQGGYDIALTYGHPLPPSPATCYPIISTSSSSLPLPSPTTPTPTPTETPPPPLLQALPLPLPSPPTPTPPPPPSLQPLPPYDHGHGHSDCSPDLYQYGFWPFLSPEEEKSHDDDAAAEFGYWNQWRRAGEYLFGYSEGLGERRIGVDSYGIPIYADKIHAPSPLTLHFEPDSVNRRLDHNRTNYDHDDDEWSNVERKDGDRHYSYEEEPIRVQHSNVGITMPLSLTYHEEDYEEQVDHRAEWHSSYTEGGNGNDFYGHPQHDYERHYNEHHSCVQLEPYKPTWSQNLSYQEIYEGGASFHSYWHSASYDETGDVSHSVRHHDLNGERYYHEQLHSVQLEPFKPAWTQNPNFYQPFAEVSHSSWADDSREDSNKYFSSFLEYPQYDE
ncbi:uncharacterized protein M6B38_131775 [Iris pallida]|uniref:Uncharacterized protein n=1 Tax=Iris pallida TaxID=29817 RepID=A0AAX6FRT3_IRIPA|nr:uncharacterized protein M6B38_131775 [Iris pallida]